MCAVAHEIVTLIQSVVNAYLNINSTDPLDVFVRSILSFVSAATQRVVLSIVNLISGLGPRNLVKAGLRLADKLFGE